MLSHGPGGGEILRPPVMAPGPQFPDHVWCGHGKHGAAGMSQAVAADRTVERACEPAPPPAAHHQQVSWPIGSADERWARRSSHDDRINHEPVRHAAKRLVKGGAQTLASRLLPRSQQHGAWAAPVRYLPAGRSPGEQWLQYCPGRPGLGRCDAQRRQAPHRAAHSGDHPPGADRHRLTFSPAPSVLHPPSNSRSLARARSGCAVAETGQVVLMAVLTPGEGRAAPWPLPGRCHRSCRRRPCLPQRRPRARRAFRAGLAACRPDLLLARTILPGQDKVALCAGLAAVLKVVQHICEFPLCPAGVVGIQRGLSALGHLAPPICPLPLLDHARKPTTVFSRIAHSLTSSLIDVHSPGAWKLPPVEPISSVGMPASCISAASVQAFMPVILGRWPSTSCIAATTTCCIRSWPWARNGSRSRRTATSPRKPGSVSAISAKMASISPTRSLRCSPGCVPISIPRVARLG